MFEYFREFLPARGPLRDILRASQLGIKPCQRAGILRPCLPYKSLHYNNPSQISFSPVTVSRT